MRASPTRARRARKAPDAQPPLQLSTSISHRLQHELLPSAPMSVPRWLARERRALERRLSELDELAESSADAGYGDYMFHQFLDTTGLNPELGRIVLVTAVMLFIWTHGRAVARSAERAQGPIKNNTTRVRKKLFVFSVSSSSLPPAPPHPQQRKLLRGTVTLQSMIIQYTPSAEFNTQESLQDL